MLSLSFRETRQKRLGILKRCNGLGLNDTAVATLLNTSPSPCSPGGAASSYGDLAPLLEISFDAAFLFTSAGSLVSFNKAAEQLVGRSCQELAGCTLRELLAGEDQRWVQHALGLASGQTVSSNASLRRPDGDMLPCVVNAGKAESGALVVFLRPLAGSGNDKCSMEHLALHDVLTGLPNRSLLEDRLGQAMAQAKRWKSIMAVVFIDLDGFKPINDNYGHECGDHVLKVVSARLSALLRASDTVARLGGDEFVAVLTELKQPVHASLTAGRMLRSLTQPIAWEDGSVCVSASLGVSIFPGDDDTPEGLVKKADEAMYHAKKSGKGGYAFFNESRFFE